MNFKSRTALVTGGTKGIGAAIASQLESAGARVIAVGSRDVDFRDGNATEAFARKMTAEKIDVLVNNAGINRIAPVSEIDPKDWDDIQNVNVRAPLILMKALVPGMINRGYGRIVNVTSIFANVSRAQRGSYSASKFALTGLTKAAALDCAQKNVLINAIAPGFVDTELTRSVLKEHEIEALADQVPMGRLGTPDEIARVVLFLASDLNTFMTGQTLLVDGGFTCV